MEVLKEEKNGDFQPMRRKDAYFYGNGMGRAREEEREREKKCCCLYSARSIG